MWSHLKWKKKEDQAKQQPNSVINSISNFNYLGFYLDLQNSYLFLQLHQLRVTHQSLLNGMSYKLELDEKPSKYTVNTNLTM